jgi:mannose-1-phosphate guanylyltransferase/mannose-6-phosphate isomerase
MDIKQSQTNTQSLMENVVPVILSGGSGTRLWPTSRKKFPKQLLKLNGAKSMIQRTVDRVTHLQVPILVCNEEQRFMIAKQLQEVGCRGTLIIEPCSRNTAPAIAVAAMQAISQATSKASDPLLLVQPADHLIGDQEAFQVALDVALLLADTGKIVTFGVPPAVADTGFGYIKVSAGSGGSRSEGGSIERFVEKPDLATANEYLSSGDYFWNSGMFLFKASVYLRELEKHNPEMFAQCQQAYQESVAQAGAVCLSEPAFALCPNDSIDYAIMEKTDSAWLVPLNTSWKDLGNWSAMWEAAEKDAEDNVQWGDVLAEDCESSFFQSDGRLIAAIGVKDLIVVDTKDAILVADKSRVQEVKSLVARLEQQGRTEHLSHREVMRPWGSYDSIGQGHRFQVKLIKVNPGESLSLQMHHYRAEHWIVVSGTALVERDGEEQLVSENESVYIQIGQRHRLTNPGCLPLQLIEVQSGCYLGEDDIVRYSDNYNRVEQVSA